MTTESRWRHEFSVLHEERWKYRDPGEWLRDLWQFDRDGESDLTVTGARLVAGRWLVDAVGTDRALRWACVAFNQHAEQSPSDATPAGEAERLEDTLSGNPISVRVGVDGPLTFAELKSLLWNMDIHPATRVVVAVEDGWHHVAEIGVPTSQPDTEHCALTLYLGDEFDSRDC